MAKIKINLPVTIKIMKEKAAKDAPFVAYIPEFDISSCGKTEEGAIKNVREVLEIALETISKKLFSFPSLSMLYSKTLP